NIIKTCYYIKYEAILFRVDRPDPGRHCLFVAGDGVVLQERERDRILSLEQSLAKRFRYCELETRGRISAGTVHGVFQGNGLVAEIDRRLGAAGCFAGAAGD